MCSSDLTMQQVDVPAERHVSQAYHAGAFVGGRWTLAAGLTLQAQVGVRHVWTSNALNTGTSPTVNSSEQSWRSMAALTGGWAF